MPDQSRLVICLTGDNISASTIGVWRSGRCPFILVEPGGGIDMRLALFMCMRVEESLSMSLSGYVRSAKIHPNVDEKTGGLMQLNTMSRERVFIIQ
jgi:hypothetical protein